MPSRSRRASPHTVEARTRPAVPAGLHAAWDPGDRSLFMWAGARGGFATPPDVLAAAESAVGVSLDATPATRRLALPGARSVVAVRGARILPAACVRHLARATATASSVAGDDFLAWAHAARFALELVARGRYLPAIRGDTEAAAARWDPVFTEPADATRLRALAGAAPGVAFSLAGDAAPARAVEDFVGALVDAGVRAALAGLRSQCTLPSTPRLERRLPAALVGADAALEPGGNTVGLQRLLREWEEWRAPAVADAAAFRLAVRLDAPPAPDPAARSPQDEPRGEWTLHYHLQAGDDPSLLLPAERVWREGARAPEVAARGVRDPQELLLAGLGRAARVSEAVAASLARARPTGAPLADLGVRRFFEEDAPRLAACGVAVLLPGLKPLAKAIALRLRVGAPSSADGRGASSRDGPTRVGFGLDAVVEFRLETALGGEAISDDDLARLATAKGPLVAVRGQWVLLAPGDVEAARALWSRRQTLTVGEALRVAGAGEAGGFRVESIEGDGVFATLFPTGDDVARAVEPPPAPDGLRATLRPYQLRGFAWLSNLRALGLGACLADDMGLGKTLQVLASEVSARERGIARSPTLVVCPASVVTNWAREAARFAPGLRVVIHHGSDRAGEEELAASVASSDIVLTTYALLVRDLGAIERVAWDAIVLDEAQNVKNPGSQQARAARAAGKGP